MYSLIVLARVTVCRSGRTRVVSGDARGWLGGSSDVGRVWAVGVVGEADERF